MKPSNDVPDMQDDDGEDEENVSEITVISSYYCQYNSTYYTDTLTA